jgi:hypothetical protein
MALINYHANPTESWQNNLNLMDSNGGHHHLCKIVSNSCSLEMSDVPDLCKWHRLRMAHVKYIHCNCNYNYACHGDSIGRGMFRDYYNIQYDAIPIINSIGQIYCCNEAHNRDSETHICGNMFVCPNHITSHPNCVILNNINDSSEDTDNALSDDSGYGSE